MFGYRNTTELLAHAYQSVSPVACASEDAVQVLADAVDADVVEERALVDVDAPLRVRRVRMHVAHLAFAGKRSL